MGEVVRSLLILKSGKFYVLDGKPSVSHVSMVGETVLGVHVEVPLSNVDVVESYPENRLGTLRNRLDALGQATLP